MSERVDSAKAMAIAMKFFRRHHQEVSVVDIALKDSVWTVTVSTGLASKRIRKIMIDANFGNILGYV